MTPPRLPASQSRRDTQTDAAGGAKRNSRRTPQGGASVEDAGQPQRPSRNWGWSAPRVRDDVIQAVAYGVVIVAVLAVLVAAFWRH